MSNRLEGRVAAITGASSGIGRAAAELFVAEGANVVIGDIQDDAGQALAEALGDVAVYAHCDVTAEDDVAAMVDTAVDRFGQLDVIYNNAGIVGAVGPVDTTPAAEWHATMDVLLHGVFYGVKHAARVMKPRMSGSIISMSSTAGVMGGPRSPRLRCGQARRGRAHEERGRRTVPLRNPGELYRPRIDAYPDGCLRPLW